MAVSGKVNCSFFVTIKIESMKLYEFILLNEEKKKQAVLHQGVLIAKRSLLNSMIFLFQLESYYVEAVCNVENRNISEFRVFGDTKPLHPYLDAIAIDDL